MSVSPDGAGPSSPCAESCTDEAVDSSSTIKPAAGAARDPASSSREHRSPSSSTDAFGHYCEEHPQLPKANAELWRRKLLSNGRRGATNQATLEPEDWRVLRLWEHDDAEAAASVVEEELGRWKLIIAGAANLSKQSQSGRTRRCRPSKSLLP